MFTWVIFVWKRLYYRYSSKKICAYEEIVSRFIRDMHKYMIIELK